ncbi:unc-105 [Pristionchus pacificus]|uniref:Ion channel n=1 Tax=Pristionchus pacificus TaxID=54126 RepID=A0A2A6B6V6_PRIPA|nr:unc-105 [Pristionchus pacificus]|eukprot:PDM61583.1 ion channel [Pristionchus pacificus]
MDDGLGTPKERTVSADLSMRKESRVSRLSAPRRQISEDSRSIRFHPDILNSAIAQQSLANATTNHHHHGIDWRNRARRISRIPTAGLTRIRVPGRLNYKEIRQRFERQSTFHGVSHAALAPTSVWRWFWYCIFFVCLFALLAQIFFLFKKYSSYPKTVDLDLKFENAPFPSITLCNLNPYKKSMIYSNPATKSTMEAFANLVAKGDQTEGVANILNSLNRSPREAAALRKRQRQKRRRKEPRRYHQVFAQCLCDTDESTGLRKQGSCLSAKKGKIEVDVSATESTPLSLYPSRCLCQLDVVSHALWPCFPYNTWKEKVCAECVDDSGHCPMRFYKGPLKFEDIPKEELTRRYLNMTTSVDLCLCHKEYNHCVQNNDDRVIPEIDPNEDLHTLNITSKAYAQLEALGRVSTTTTTTPSPEIQQALGFDDVQDEIALSAAAQQNLIFAVADLEEEKKMDLSHTQEEFILKCSFNQKDCNVEQDFKLHYDQTYGNCFTFNWNRSSAVTAHRAGANYGLRVMLYANVSEYLPTSESVGFRITVHDKWIVPFPDAFGYNAPTGFLSSFGVRMKQFVRIQAPHGHCKFGGEESGTFVYNGFNYSVEACHRSCTQKKIIDSCGCADPMYPLPKEGNATFCHVTDTGARDCIRKTTIELGVLIAEGAVEDCPCHQPCLETNYEVTYSAARWPSGAAKVMECMANDNACLAKYRSNSAMIQIFYEELNYETLIETEAYGIASFMADLGGVTGLWIGASVVPLCELIALVFICAQAYYRNKKEEAATNSSDKSHKNSTNTLHKLSVQEMRLSLSTHSSQSKISLRSNTRKSLHSLRSSKKSLDFPLPEGTEEEESASEESDETQGSCRYLAPGEELPCLCKYNDIGHIVVMKALCPVHGFMVRRNYDYSVSNSEEGTDEDNEVHKEEPYYDEPYTRKLTRRQSSRLSRKKSTKKKKPEGEGGAEEQPGPSGYDGPGGDGKDEGDHSNQGNGDPPQGGSESLSVV